MTDINTGAPHFRSLAKQHRQSRYTLLKFINEVIDNVIKKNECSEISINTEIDDDGKLQEVKISDNYTEGFKNINEKGTDNPMNMGHINKSHDNDDETSEYGVGLKAGAISTANQLEIFTNVVGLHTNYRVEANFTKMENDPDVNSSYNPKIYNIDDATFSDNHPFNKGSTIKITKIRASAYHTTNDEDITDSLISDIGKTYSKFFPEKTIRVNGKIVSSPHDFFSDKNCQDFTMKSYISIMKNPNSDEKVYMRKTRYHSTAVERYHIYNIQNKVWDMKKQDHILQYERDNYELLYPYSLNFNYSIEIKSTFTRFSDIFRNDDSEELNTGIEKMLPQDIVNIYKDNRLYGSHSFKKHNNGTNNYTIHDLSFKSKAIGKILGITYNKELTMDGQNDLIECIKQNVSDHRIKYSADTSTSLYKKLHDKAIDKNIDAMNIPDCGFKNKVNKPNKSTVQETIDEDCQITQYPESPLLQIQTIQSDSPKTPTLLITSKIPHPTLETATTHTPVTPTLETATTPTPVTPTLETVTTPTPVTPTLETVTTPTPVTPTVGTVTTPILTTPSLETVFTHTITTPKINQNTESLEIGSSNNDNNDNNYLRKQKTVEIIDRLNTTMLNNIDLLTYEKLVEIFNLI